jgi:hypothetical protein
MPRAGGKASPTARDLLCCRRGIRRLWRRGWAFSSRRPIADSRCAGREQSDHHAQQTDASRPLRQRLRSVSALSLARMDAVGGGRRGEEREGLSISPRGGRAR